MEVVTKGQYPKGMEMGNVTLIKVTINVEDIMLTIKDKLLSVIVVGQVTKYISALQCLLVTGVLSFFKEKKKGFVCMA